MPRFLQTVEQRIIVSKWDPTAPQTMPLITLLDRRATDRQYHYEWGAPASLSATVRADDPEVNILYDDNFTMTGNFSNSDYPFLAEGVRLIHSFRREAPIGGDPWVCRFSGPVLEIEDSSDGNRNLSRFVAFDPWAYLFQRPCVRCQPDFTLAVGDPPDCTIDVGTGRPAPMTTPIGDVGFQAGTRLNEVIGFLLQRTIDAHGPCMIDAGDGTNPAGDGNDYAGTAFWDGIIEDCAVLTEPLRIQAGTSVGEAWQMVMETGLVGIWLKPIYDPTNRPGYCAELWVFRTDSVYDGVLQYQLSLSANGAEMAWDRAGHDFTEVLRPIDGTDRANKIIFYGSSGVASPLQTSSQSVTRFGQSWSQQQLVRVLDAEPMAATVEKELARREQSRRVWQFSPAPEFTYSPFTDYNLGWYLGFYHSNRLRQEVPDPAFDFWAYGRILGFDIAASDEGVETVTGLLVSVDDVPSP